jgi:acetyl/propionyl-CoA carboxylase alpha subunit
MGTNFDSLCAKLIAIAGTREMAVKRMQFMLRETVISGIGTNLEYLNQIAHHPKVVEGKMNTHFLDQEFKQFSPSIKGSHFELLSAFEESGNFYEVQRGSGDQNNQSHSSLNLWSANPL